jgi:hypothetical protein
MLVRAANLCDMGSVREEMGRNYTAIRPESLRGAKSADADGANHERVAPPARQARLVSCAQPNEYLSRRWH